MSLQSPTPYLFQYHDGDLCGQSFVDPRDDFFDQFLTFETQDSESPLLPLFPDSPHLVKSAMSNQSNMAHANEEEQSHYRLSQGGECSWIYSQPASPRPRRGRSKTLSGHSSNQPAISDSDLLSLEGIHLKSPKIHPQSPSLPPTPSPIKYQANSLRRKKNFTRSVSSFRPVKDADAGQRSPSRSTIRKPSSPAKMSRGPQYSQQSLEEWTQRLASEADKFDFGFQTSSIPPMSPPPSARVSNASSASERTGILRAAGQVHMEQQHENEKLQGQINRGNGGNHGNSFQWEHPVPQFAVVRNGKLLHSPMTTPTFGGDGELRHSPDMYASQNQHVASWAQGMPQDFTETMYGRQSSYLDVDENGTPLWWPQIEPTTHHDLPITQPTGYNRHQSQNAKSLALQLQSDQTYPNPSASNLANGLMIQMPPSPSHQKQAQSYTISTPLRHQRSGGYFTHEAPPPIPAHIAVSHSPQRQYVDHQRSPTRTRTRAQRPRDSSPCPSPISHPTTPRLHNALSTPNFSNPNLHNVLSTPNYSTPNLHIRKSRSMARKGSESALASPRASHQRSNSSHANHARSRSNGGAGSPSKGSRGGGGGTGGGVEFCNFTPRDSGRILSGVAPSGSSKTKARREKEAQERRRRLSAAAVRAVERAGGDVRELGELMGGEEEEMV